MPTICHEVMWMQVSEAYNWSCNTESRPVHEAGRCQGGCTLLFDLMDFIQFIQCSGQNCICPLVSTSADQSHRVEHWAMPDRRHNARSNVWRMEPPWVEILVVVVNIPMRTLNTEVMKG